MLHSSILYVEHPAMKWGLWHCYEISNWKKSFSSCWKVGTGPLGGQHGQGARGAGEEGPGAANHLRYLVLLLPTEAAAAAANLPLQRRNRTRGGGHSTHQLIVPNMISPIIFKIFYILHIKNDWINQYIMLMPNYSEQESCCKPNTSFNPLEFRVPRST